MKAIIAAGIAISVWALLGAAARADDPVEEQAGALDEMREVEPQKAPVELDGEVLTSARGSAPEPTCSSPS